MSELVRYDAMCQAIAAAHSIDEAKDIRDKAVAIEAYARQANNRQNELWASEIRIRAERRCGQMLAEQEKATGARGNLRGQGAKIVQSCSATTQKTLAGMGISKDQSSRWQKLAAVPEPEFEATFAAPAAKPTTTAIIERHERANAPAPPPPKPQKTPGPPALWLWGTLLEFERDGVLKRNAREVLDDMLPHMRETTLELAPKVIDWLEGLVNE